MIVTVTRGEGGGAKTPKILQTSYVHASLLAEIVLHGGRARAGLDHDDIWHSEYYVEWKFACVSLCSVVLGQILIWMVALCLPTL